MRERNCNRGYLTFSPVIIDEKKVYALVFQMTLGLVKNRSCTENSKGPEIMEKRQNLH